MPRLKLSEAFATYGATLTNVQWAVSAISDDDSLVLSCWQHRLTPKPDGVERYEDRLSRWAANVPGKNLLKKHLARATDRGLPVRMVVATLHDPTEDTDGDARRLRKTFSIRPSMIGRIVAFNGDEFAIEFRSA